MTEVQVIMLYAVVGYCIGDLVYKIVRIIKEGIE